jgi:periplasmic protein TonB
VTGPVLEDRLTRQRWGLSFALILALHAAVLGFAWLRRPADSPPAAPLPAVVMIDLAPMPAPAAQPRPEPEVEPTAPPAPPAPRVEVPVAPPKPPKRPQPVRETPKPPAELQNPAPNAASPAEAAVPSAPPAPPQPPSQAVPTWQGLLLGRLEQFKRYPASAQARRQQGVAYLRFTMDRTGRVLSARIERSAGVEALDEETLALIHRAEPLPAPPPDVPGNPIELVVPVQFFLK